MSSHQTRSAWNSTTLLLAVLCLALLGWRLLTRVEQYHPLAAGRSTPVTFFDANDRTSASSGQSRSNVRPVTEQRDRLFATVVFQPPVTPKRTDQLDTRIALPHICIRSIPLFSNPPPSFA